MVEEAIADMGKLMDSIRGYFAKVEEQPWRTLPSEQSTPPKVPRRRESKLERRMRRRRERRGVA